MSSGHPKFSVDDIRRAEEALARIGIKRSLRATGVDRDDFIELHVAQLVELLIATQSSRKRAKKPDGR